LDDCFDAGVKAINVVLLVFLEFWGPSHCHAVCSHRFREVLSNQ